MRMKKKLAMRPLLLIFALADVPFHTIISNSGPLKEINEDFA